MRPREQARVAVEEVLAHLRKRRGILEGLCITGGEPTLQPDLEDFVRDVKALGYAVKLDTNGYQPEALARLLEQGLIDYVAMDVKASRENYINVTGMSFFEGRNGYKKGTDGFDLRKIEESVELLKHSGIPYEFRTTAVKGLHCVGEFEEIGRWLSGGRAYFIQSYQESGEILGAGKVAMESFSLEELREMARLAGKYVRRVELRGVE